MRPLGLKWWQWLVVVLLIFNNAMSNPYTQPGDSAAYMAASVLGAVGLVFIFVHLWRGAANKKETLTADSRAQAIGISRYLLALGVGAVLLWIVAEVATPLLDHARDTSNANSYPAQGTEWLARGVDMLPIYFLFLGLVGIIAYSVYRRGQSV